LNKRLYTLTGAAAVLRVEATALLTWISHDKRARLPYGRTFAIKADFVNRLLQSAPMRRHDQDGLRLQEPTGPLNVNT
jgi:hypothetical protein